jgi:hypothetical protein
MSEPTTHHPGGCLYGALRYVASGVPLDGGLPQHPEGAPL